MKKKKYFVLFILVGLIAYTSLRYGGEIYSNVYFSTKLGEMEKKQQESVDLSSFYPFDWDQFVHIGSYTNGKEVNTMLGKKAVEDDEMLIDYENDQKLLFIKNDKIIKEWSMPSIQEIQVTTNSGGVVSRGDALFEIKKVDGKLFLKQVKK
ncbi:hypothetical protein [Paenibacillus lutrae]|uniref:Uncharacterized protein n=1 Tax=Paenibacillus lutrae TaxID=2078573 RepID=A0A7X3K0B9_9BACL|nr:hypothetical protein [Paenibacillus lutrae]MVP00998.1 hypothetical protein [Paenibacillus lutrae]